MSSSSPLKPWEVANNNNNNLAKSNSTSLPTPLSTPATSSENLVATNGVSSMPELPSRPQQMAARPLGYNGNGIGAGGAYSGYGTYGGGYGSTTGYGGYGTSTGYGGMSRFGGGGLYGSSMYGSSMYGNSMYGAGGMYGGGGMYGNRMMSGYGSRGGIGPNGMPFEGGEMSFTQQMELSTQSTFQILDQIVQAFGGFSQMLESTFFATHSSFMAMIGVADQFGQLRNYLGQVFSILSLYNSAKDFIYRIAGQRPPLDPSALSVDSFQKEMKPKPSKKPLLIFLGLVFGLPYLMAKLIQRMEKNKPALQAAVAGNLAQHDQSQLQQPSDIRNLEFCKALYDFQSNTHGDLSFRKGDLVAILSKLEPNSEWWRGRTQEGRIGIFPRNYVSLISRKETSPTPAPSDANFDDAFTSSV